jgi:glyoxylase-like metal-dependent hydrolase (beta-lactamase superfamily II)
MRGVVVDLTRPTEVAPGVHVFTSRREHTTSTLITSGRTAVLVDPAWEPDELDGIAGYIAAHGLTVTAGFSTHAHFDHLLWHPGFGDAPRWASLAAAAVARRDRKQLRGALGPEFPPKLGKLVGRVAPVPSTGLILDGPEPVELITHDGHAPGHTALWLPARRVLLAGDMLSDVEPPLPSYSDEQPTATELTAYLAGLDALAPYVAQTDVLVPGHGHPTDRPMQRLDADRRLIDSAL